MVAISGGVPPLQGLQPGVGGAAFDRNQEPVDDPAEVGAGVPVVEPPYGHPEPVTAPDGAGKPGDLPPFLPDSLDGFRVDGAFSHAYRVRFSRGRYKLRVS